MQISPQKGVCMLGEMHWFMLLSFVQLIDFGKQ